MFHGSEGGLIDVGAWNVPARREAGLVEDQRPLRIGDDAVTMADHEVTGGLANVDAVVAVGGMAHDPFVFFVESVHGRARRTRRVPAVRSRRRAGRCAATPLAARVLLARPDGCTRTWARGRGAGWYARCVPECLEKRRSPGSRLPDSGPVRRAGGRARYRRSRFRRSARACAGATARRTTVSWAAVRARETGRLLPVRADLVARTVPLLYLPTRLTSLGYALSTSCSSALTLMARPEISLWDTSACCRSSSSLR